MSLLSEEVETLLYSLLRLSSSTVRKKVQGRVPLYFDSLFKGGLKGW